MPWRVLLTEPIHPVGMEALEAECTVVRPPDGSNMVVLPHAGAATHESMERMASGAMANALAVLKGEHPDSVLNPEVSQGKG